jgi:hypothetical protein
MEVRGYVHVLVASPSGKDRCTVQKGVQEWVHLKASLDATTKKQARVPAGN